MPLPSPRRARRRPAPRRPRRFGDPPPLPRGGSPPRPHRRRSPRSAAAGAPRESVRARVCLGAGDGEHVAVGVLEPGDLGPLEVRDPLLVGLERTIVVVLEIDAVTGELIDGAFHVVGAEAGDGGAGLPRVVRGGKDVQSASSAASPGYAAIAFLGSAGQSQLALVEL